MVRVSFAQRNSILSPTRNIHGEKVSSRDFGKRRKMSTKLTSCEDVILFLTQNGYANLFQMVPGAYIYILCMPGAIAVLS